MSDKEYDVNGNQIIHGNTAPYIYQKMIAYRKSIDKLLKENRKFAEQSVNHCPTMNFIRELDVSGDLLAVSYSR